MKTDRAMVLAAIGTLHLCDAAIHEQFRSDDVAAVVGCEKHHGLRDLIGCTDCSWFWGLRDRFGAETRDVTVD